MATIITSWDSLVAQVAAASNNSNILDIKANMQENINNNYDDRWGTYASDITNAALDQVNNTRSFRDNQLLLNDAIALFAGFQGYYPTPKSAKGYNVLAATISQEGTSAPTLDIAGTNEIGAYTLARTSAGLYTLTFTTPPTGKVIVLTGNNVANEASSIAWEVTSDNIRIRTATVAVSGANLTYTPADDLLTDFPFEIKAYNHE